MISQLKALRYTPAGIPVIEFRLKHESEREEAGAKRKVSAELDAIAFEAQARLLAASAMGRPVRAQGFLSAKSKHSAKPVLHVTNIEFTEGN